MLIERVNKPDADHVAAVTLINDDGHYSDSPFRCRSERAVEEIVGTLLDIYPSIDIVR